MDGTPGPPARAERFRALFEADVEVFYTYGGTGANVVALQCMLAPHDAVICPSSAHLNVDECGAPERFTGAKLIDIPSSDGKLSPGTVRSLLQPSHDEHHVTPRVLAISQPTELGTLYTLDEMGELAGLAHEHGLLLYVDGARFANAVAALGCSVRELTYGAGVDVLTFGGTKNGLLYGEAVVLLRPELARRARFARKQAGQLASKMRFIAAQFDALLEGDLWLAGAANANDMARRLASRLAGVPHVEIIRPVEANSLFARATCAAGCSIAKLVVLLGLGPQRGARAVDDKLRDRRPRCNEVRRRSPLLRQPVHLRHVGLLAGTGCSPRDLQEGNGLG